MERYLEVFYRLLAVYYLALLFSVGVRYRYDGIGIRWLFRWFVRINGIGKIVVGVLFSLALDAACGR